MDDTTKQARFSSEGASDSSSQDHRSISGQSSRLSSKGQIRHRASIACASCRERRIRCVVPEGSTECTQCKRSGTECIIKNDDERRRPISKAYMSSLSSRISLLETMLTEHGVALPPAIHPPKTRQEAQTSQSQAQAQQQRQCSSSPKSWESNLLISPERDSSIPFAIKEETDNHETSQDEDTSPSGFTLRSSGKELFLGGDFSSENGKPWQQASKASCNSEDLRWKYPFYGPTASNHAFALPLSMTSLAPRQHGQRARKFIDALNSSTKDHLMSCFWDHYNPIHQVVDQKTFEADQISQRPESYSPFLHITMLAAGYRFTDRDGEAVKRLTLGNWESTLHRESKSMVDSELDRPEGVTTIQALLLLADLEFGAGRDTAGWVYSGTANRLAFAMGLHVEYPKGDITEPERSIRCRTMTACVMFDRHWSLLLGRPTSIKNQDLATTILTKVVRPLSSIVPAVAPPESAKTACQILDESAHNQLAGLMDLASKIADSQNTAYSTAAIFATSEAESKAYLRAVTLDQHLQSWYRRLPEHLTWTPANIKTAPFSFFMLHQQYHVCMILVYRPWAKYGTFTVEGTNSRYQQSSVSEKQPRSIFGFNLTTFSLPSAESDGRMSLSRRMCAQHAVRVARIFWHHRQRGFDGRKMGLLGIQHAGASALALMASLAHQSADLDQRSKLSYLHVLSTAIFDMSRVYQPAARMYHLFKSILADIRGKLAAQPGTLRPTGLQNMSKALLVGTPIGGQIASRTSTRPVPSFSLGNPTKPDSNSILISQQPHKKRRLGPGSRRASELAYPTPSFFKSGHDQFTLDSVSRRLSLDMNKPFSLGKHGRQYAHDDNEISANGSASMSKELGLTDLFDFEFTPDPPAVIDLASEHNGQQDEAKASGVPAVADDTSFNSSVFEVKSPADGSSDANENSMQQQSNTNNNEEQKSTYRQSKIHADKDSEREAISPESVDATIEEWLSEPPGLTPTSLHFDSYSASPPERPIHHEDALPPTTANSNSQPTVFASSPPQASFFNDNASIMVQSSEEADGELELWMAAAFGINSDGIDQMLSRDSLSPSLCELVRSVERAVGGSSMEVKRDLRCQGVRKVVCGSDVRMKDVKPVGAGVGKGASVTVDVTSGFESMSSRKGLKALDYLEL